MTEAALPIDVYAKEILAYHGIKCRHLRRARDGREHFIYTFEDATRQELVLKVPRPDGLIDPNWPDRTPFEALMAEREAIEHMDEITSAVQDVRAPDTYRILDGEPPVAIMERLPGVTPEMRFESGAMGPDLLKHVCYVMGGLLATIHTVRRPDGPSAIPMLRGADPNTARLLHMDFHLGNVLGTTQLATRWKPTGVIDWTCAKWGPREADMAEIGVSLLATNPWALEPLLSGYHRVSGLALAPKRVWAYIAREMKRRLRDDPPETEAILNLWSGRLTEWWDDTISLELGVQ